MTDELQAPQPEQQGNEASPSRQARLMATMTAGPLPRLVLALSAFSLGTAVIFASVLGFGADIGLVDRELGLRGLIASGLLLLPPVILPRIVAGLAIRGRGQPLVTWSMAVALLASVIAGASLVAREGQAAWIALALDGLVLAVLAPLTLSALHRRLPPQARLHAVATLLGFTFLAAALGIGAAHLLRSLPGGEVLLAILLVAVTGFGWWLTRRLAPATVGEPPAGGVPSTLIDQGGLSGTIDQMRNRQTPWAAALGVAWFGAGTILLVAYLPALVRQSLGGDVLVEFASLAALGLGVILGTVLSLRLSRGVATAAHTPLALIVMALAVFDLFVVAGNLPAFDPAGGARSVIAVFSDAAAVRILIDALFFGTAGAILATPLIVLIADPDDELATAHHYAIGGLLVGSGSIGLLLLALLLRSIGLSIADLFLVTALIALATIPVGLRLWPDHLFKAATARLLRLAFRVEVTGVENIARAGDRVVIVSNHASALDAPLLAAFLPGTPHFAATARDAEGLWARLLGKLIKIFPVDTSKPMAVKSLISAVETGTPMIIFPEGRVTVTGGLMKVYEGPGMVADRAGATILPVRIEGAEHSLFTRLSGKTARRLFPKITIHVLEPRRLDVPPALTGRLRRQAVGNKLYDVMIEMMFQSANLERNLWQALLDARRTHGGGSEIVEDQDRKPLTYNRLVMACLVLGRALARLTKPAEKVGVLLPNTAGVAVTFFALIGFGRVPAMLNFSAGPSTMASACRTAKLKTVLSSRRFVAMAKLEEAIKAISEVCEVVYLEDVRGSLTTTDKLWGLAASRLPRFLHGDLATRPDDPAVVLFTSGSEGLPKGVVLSHRNLNANQLQVASIVDINKQDKVLNPLPVFHSFGLLGGLVLPLLAGVKTFLYPSPLHYKAIPELVYATSSTMMFGTDTFLNGYARAAHPYDFYSTRYIFAGAERVKDETRRTYAEKFGVRILEGYGTTECSPVVAVSTAMQFKPGSVGRLLPAMRARLEPVEGIARGGRLVVTGPNIMLGYCWPDRPAELAPPEGGWYDTGDIVEIDDLGFITILGRAKRFAKIAGEMVSLAAVEHEASILWPDFAHAVTNLPDPAKGERLIMLTTCPEAQRARFSTHLHDQGLTELMCPKTIYHIEELPLLGSGKTDYQAVKQTAEKLSKGG